VQKVATELEEVPCLKELDRLRSAADIRRRAMDAWLGEGCEGHTEQQEKIDAISAQTRSCPILYGFDKIKLQHILESDIESLGYGAELPSEIDDDCTALNQQFVLIKELVRVSLKASMRLHQGYKDELRAKEAQAQKDLVADSKKQKGLVAKYVLEAAAAAKSAANKGIGGNPQAAAAAALPVGSRSKRAGAAALGDIDFETLGHHSIVHHNVDDITEQTLANLNHPFFIRSDSAKAKALVSLSHCSSFKLAFLAFQSTFGGRDNQKSGTKVKTRAAFALPSGDEVRELIFKSLGAIQDKFGEQTPVFDSEVGENAFKSATQSMLFGFMPNMTHESPEVRQMACLKLQLQGERME
jgi:hypothetical protein